MSLPSDNERLPLARFSALPGAFAPRDVQDLMAWPFFSLAKSRRTAPIDFRMGEVSIRVEGTIEHGLATIWDADVLIWAASQLVQARDAGFRRERGASTFIRRGCLERGQDKRINPTNLFGHWLNNHRNVVRDAVGCP